jgi:predicted secreted protein
VAKYVAINHDVTINGVDFSQSIAAVTFEITADEVQTTAFQQGWRSRIGGLKDASVSLDFHQDFGAASVDATLHPLLGSVATVVVVPTAGSVNATNPSYSGEFLVTQYTPFSSSVGDLATLSVSWPAAGTAGVSRGTV